MQLTHIRLLVNNLDDCFRFYRDVMGFPVLWGQEGDGYTSFRAGEGAILALFGRGEMARTIGTADLPLTDPGQDSAMLIFTVDDLEGEVAALKAKGVPMTAEITDRPGWGTRTAHLRDPAGTLIELGSALPLEEWNAELREAAKRYPGEEG